MTHDVWVLFGMCGCGAVCALLYDAFRGAHHIMKKHDVIVIISDVIYWIIVCAVIIYSLWYLNTGIIRAYEFAGLILGAVLYFCTVSRFVFKFFLTINTICVKIVVHIYKILLTLCGFLYKITVRPVRFVTGRLKNKGNTIGG